MSRPRNGRIARLPRPLREELNRRLDEGESGRSLVAWLNGLPEVIAQADEAHGGKPLREQNLSEWRKGGYRDWQIRQESYEIAARLGEDAAAWADEERPPLTDSLAHWLAARYVLATRELAETSGEEGWHRLRDACRDVVEIRRGDHSAQRLALERERLDLERRREEQRTDEELLAWAMDPANRDRICRCYRARGAQMAQLREMMFGKALDSETTAQEES